MATKQKVIDSYLAGFSEAQYQGTKGTFNSAIAIDPDHSLLSSDIRTSGMLVPVVYEKFSSSLAGNVKWLITNPKNSLIYAYTDNPGGTAAELNSIGTLLTSPNIKAYYRMTTSALTTDSSGQSKTTTNNNTVGEATGKFAGGADFGTSNTNKYLSIADALSYTGGAYSITMWAKITTELTTNGDLYVLASVAEATADTYLQIIYQQVAGVKKVTLRRIANGVSITDASITQTLGTSAFHLITGTYDGGTLTLYVDNVASSGVAASGAGVDGVTPLLSIGGTPAPYSATGGTITYAGGRTIHTFTSSGTFDSSGIQAIDCLVVAGGGGGSTGSNYGGGGGGGEVVVGTNVSIVSGAITITVGNGGGSGANGQDSVITGYYTANKGYSSSAQTGGNSGDGHTGGAGNTGGAPSGGGGAGDNANGGAYSGTTGGAGGAGTANSISGASVTYAGGGGGAGSVGGGAGANGGGNGGIGGSGASATANTGSGGGGAVNATGGTGGSGIVIISYPTISGFANAIIDDVACFNKALSATDVLTLFTDGGFFLSYSSALSSETIVATPSAGQANGLAYYNNYIYLATNTDIGRYGPLNGTPAYTASVWTGATLGSQVALTNTVYGFQSSYAFPNHPMVVHGDGALYVCDYINGAGKIHRVKTTKTTFEGDTNNSSLYGALTLPFGYLPTDIQSWGTDLVILAVQTTDTVINQGRAAMFFWDASATTFYKGPLFLPDSLATALEVLNGQLYIWSGNASGGVRLSKYIGGDSIQEVLFQEEGTPPPPGATSVYGNRLYWGNHVTYPEDVLGVFAYGSKTERLPSGLHCVARATNTSTTMPAITAMVPAQQANGSRNRLLVAWRDSVGYGIDKISTTGTHIAVWRSDIENVGGKFQITRIRIPLGAAVAANMEIVVKVWIDDFSSSVTLTTINNTNYSGKRKIIYHALELNEAIGEDNFCLEFSWGGTSALPVTIPIITDYSTYDDENSQ